MSLPRGRCNNCETRAPVTKVSRKVGGSYRHPGNHQQCNICEGCARRLVEQITPGHTSVSRWDVVGLRRAVERFDAEREDACPAVPAGSATEPGPSETDPGAAAPAAPSTCAASPAGAQEGNPPMDTSSRDRSAALPDDDARMARTWATESARMYREQAERVVDRLRRMADDVERALADVERDPITSPAGRFTYAAQQAVKQAHWGLANANLDTVIRVAAEADAANPRSTT